MSTKPLNSPTSLSNYAQARSLDDDMPTSRSRSRDFCNSFWGTGDAGVQTLLARIRGAARTTTELLEFWRERSAIEEEYATRLSNLAKVSLGRDEIGELRNSLDTLRLETDKQAGFHRQLAKQIRNELERPTAAICSKQAEHIQTQAVGIEKRFKAKQVAEAYVKKAREKYEGDRLRISSYTAQSKMTQGQDLERILAKLSRAKQTVQANERDLIKYSRSLEDIIPKWEKDWKCYCDACQDDEEERLEFTRENIWTYANAVSTLCVSDDQSCEQVRVALDQMEPEKEMENFIRDYGTGNAIPTLPPFGLPNEQSVPLDRHITRISTFSRVSHRLAPDYNTIPRRDPGVSTNDYSVPAETRRTATVSRRSTEKGASKTSRKPPALPIPRATSNTTSTRPESPPQTVSVDNNAKDVLFFVKAIYDYTATTPEEFDFQQGDIIAVTATPDDGWWSGELLDEQRRKPGKSIFPSNFVVLF